MSRKDEKRPGPLAVASSFAENSFKIINFYDSVSIL